MKKFNENGIKVYRTANNTESYYKQRIYSIAGSMTDQTFGTYYHRVIRQCLALFNIKPRSSMLTYAKKAQRYFQYKTSRTTNKKNSVESWWH